MTIRRVHIYENLAWLNGLAADDANSALLSCCGSREWARQMADVRPFAMIESVFASAGDVWRSISTPDRLEAFTGVMKESVPCAPDADGKLLAAARRYRDKFGFDFVIYRNGKSASELGAICEARLRNSVETELSIAAAEQIKTTEARLAVLLEK